MLARATRVFRPRHADKVLRRNLCTKEKGGKLGNEKGAGAEEEIEDVGAFRAIGGMGIAAFGAVGLAAIGAIVAFQMASWAAKEAGYNIQKSDKSGSNLPEETK